MQWLHRLKKTTTTTTTNLQNAVENTEFDTKYREEETKIPWCC